MRKRHQTRLRLEILEDRCTPSAGMGDAIGQAGGHDPVSMPMSASAESAEAANAVSAFAREAQGARVLWGESTVVDGARIVTWALVSPRDNTILATGVTFSLKLAEEMPAPGSGPDGAIAALAFPAVVQDTTFFNHLEIHSNPHGHSTPPGSVNPERNSVPHFDFHFYGVPEEQVWAIPALPPPLPAVPASRLPAGYTQPGPSILQMGRHSTPVSSLTDPNFLSTIMLAGYLPDGSQMHFIEPMISQEVLLARQDFTLPVPMPHDLGRASPTLYPTSFNALFQGNAYSFVYSDFVTVPSSASAVGPAAASFPSSNLAASAAEQPASTASALRDFSAFALPWVQGLEAPTTPYVFTGPNVAADLRIPASPNGAPNPNGVATLLVANSSAPSSKSSLASHDLEDVLENLSTTDDAAWLSN